METRTKREIMRTLEEFPLELVSIEDTRKGHIKVTLKGDTGKTGVVIFSSSPSDFRVVSNRRKDLRLLTRSLCGPDSI